MRTQKDQRVCIGQESGRRSTVWKFEARKADVYIMSRMMGSDMKVSLHESGECSFSRTNSWIKKVPGRRNVDRHFEKWTIERPTGTSALHILQIRIPESELRKVNVQESLKSVVWLGPLSSGSFISLDCHLTPPSKEDPSVGTDLQGPLICSLPLSDGRWFVVVATTFPSDRKSLERSRR
jgi:hypothetical protein